MIELKTLQQIEKMHEANRIVHEVILYAEENTHAGITTGEINDLMHDKLNQYEHDSPAFLGYHGFPAVACVSVNEEIVHGIPGDRVIQSGDLVSIDFGVYYKGYAGDSAKTFVVGDYKCEEDRKLVEETKRGLFAGIDAMWSGNTLWDIGRAIDAVARENEYGNVEKYSGHGIGKVMHEPPRVFNYVDETEPDILLREGMVFALEPMFVLGDKATKTLDDKWTVVTADGKNAVHWELSIAITADGPRILGIGWNGI